jgi:hypothetical protein
VLGALGLLIATAHFVDKWFGGVTFLFFGLDEEPKHAWARAVGHAFLGFVYVLLGMLLALRERRRADDALGDG